uniref:DUF676 domain-containing protein n=1 Tax=Anopheles dirus TaxID=7168 RepID=A0A182N3S4_9DIPT
MDSGNSGGVPVVGYCLLASNNTQRTPASTMMDGVSVWSPDAPPAEHGSNDGDCFNESKVTVSFCANAMTVDAVEQLVVKETDCQMQLMTQPNEVAVVVDTPNNRVRVALGVLIRLMLPLTHGVARGWKGLRGLSVLALLRKVRESHGLLTTLFAVAANTVSMSLSSVQGSSRATRKGAPSSAVSRVELYGSHSLVYRRSVMVLFSTLTIPLAGTVAGWASLDTLGCQPLSASLTWILLLVLVAHRIDPLLRVIKLRKDSTAASAIKPGSPTLQPSGTQLATVRVPRHLPERCVDLVVLAEPPPGEPIRADIVLIHGLHGSLVNTWKQGLWNSEGRLVNFERPPKPPLRPPKRQRHSRANLFAPPHVCKRPKFDPSDEDPAAQQPSEHDPFDESRSTSYEFAHRRYTYECGEPDEVHFADDVEYSFPTFRLRIEADGQRASAIDEPGVPAEPTAAASATASAGAKRKLPKPTKDANWSPCWPGDWLPLDCPGVRVIAVNYTTDPYLWRPVWITKRNRSSLVDRAREMSDLLIAKGVGRGHPIVWVGHSKGGIFIKQILVDAWESGRPAAEPLWRSSRGTFFYSVPHRGSPLADFNLPLLRQSVELLEIQKNCSSILELHSRFVALYHSGQLKIDVFSFVETAMTLMSVLYLRIVGIDSADPGIGEVCGVHLDHREICKPRSRSCILYTELVKLIKRVS